MGSQKVIGGGHRYPLIIVHMDGSGACYRESQVANPQSIGLLPGRTSWQPGPVEKAEDTLVQD